MILHTNQCILHKVFGTVDLVWVSCDHPVYKTLRSMKQLLAHICTLLLIRAHIHQSSSPVSLKIYRPSWCQDLDVQMANPTPLKPQRRCGDVIHPSRPRCLLLPPALPCSQVSKRPSQISHLMSSRPDRVNNWWRAAGERHRSTWSREGDTSGGYTGAGTTLHYAWSHSKFSDLCVIWSNVDSLYFKAWYVCPVQIWEHILYCPVSNETDSWLTNVSITKRGMKGPKNVYRNILLWGNLVPGPRCVVRFRLMSVEWMMIMRYTYANNLFPMNPLKAPKFFKGRPCHSPQWIL